MRIKVSVGNELFNLNCGDFTAFHISADVGSGDRSIVAIVEQCNQYASSGGLECSTLVMPQAWQSFEYATNIMIQKPKVNVDDFNKGQTVADYTSAKDGKDRAVQKEKTKHLFDCITTQFG